MQASIRRLVSNGFSVSRSWRGNIVRFYNKPSDPSTFLMNHEKRKKLRRLKAKKSRVSLTEATQTLNEFVQPELNNILCVPIKPRPAFPGWPIVLPVKDEATIKELRETYHSGNPYVALLLEDPPGVQKANVQGKQKSNKSTRPPSLVRYPEQALGKRSSTRVVGNALNDSSGDVQAGPRDREEVAQRHQDELNESLSSRSESKTAPDDSRNASSSARSTDNSNVEEKSKSEVVDNGSGSDDFVHEENEFGVERDSDSGDSMNNKNSRLEVESESESGASRGARHISRTAGSSDNTNDRGRVGNHVKDGSKTRRRRNGRHGRSFQVIEDSSEETSDSPSTLYEIGTLAEILHMPEELDIPYSEKSDSGRNRVRRHSSTGFQVKGIARIQVDSVHNVEPPLRLSVSILDDVISPNEQEEVIVLRGLLHEALRNAVQQKPEEWPMGLMDRSVGLSGGKLADLMLAHMDGTTDLQPALAEANVRRRMRIALKRLNQSGLIGGEGMKRMLEEP